MFTQIGTWITPSSDGWYTFVVSGTGLVAVAINIGGIQQNIAICSVDNGYQSISFYAQTSKPFIVNTSGTVDITIVV